MWRDDEVFRRFDTQKHYNEIQDATHSDLWLQFTIIGSNLQGWNPIPLLSALHQSPTFSFLSGLYIVTRT